MKTLPRLAAVFAAAAFAAGCASPPPPPPPPVATIGGALSSSLTASVAATAETKGAEALLAPVLAAVREELARVGYRLETETPDVTVAVRVSAEILGRSGPKRELRGTFSLVADVPVRDGMKLGSGSISVENEDLLGEEAARADLLRRALPRVRRWIAENARPEDTGLLALDLRVSCVTDAPDEDAARFGAFEKAVAGTDGVESFLPTHRDDGARQRKYRAVVRRASFPPGRFLETIAAAHPELELAPSSNNP